MRRGRRSSTTRITTAIGLALAFTAVAGHGATALATDGTGWGASWDYYTDSSYRYTLERPGLRVQGYGLDRDGIRTTLGSLEDTADDGRCARLTLFTEQPGPFTQISACGDGAVTFFSPERTFTGRLLVLGCVNASGTTNEGCIYSFVPSSADDPGLRRTGVGASWSYDAPFAFRYRLDRPGVRVTGYGGDEHAGGRTTVATVEHTEAGGCATAAVRPGSGAVSTAFACGDPGTPTSESSRTAVGLGGWVEPSACTTGAALDLKGMWVPFGAGRCVTAYIPVPR